MNTPVIQEEYISTKDFLVRVVKAVRNLWMYWRVLTLGILLGAIATIVYDMVKKKETIYGAKMVFNLELGSSNSSMGQLAGLTSAFGLGSPVQQSGDLFSGSNFMELLTSRIVFERALLKEIDIDGKKMLFANYYKDSSDIHRVEWAGGLFQAPDQEKIDFRFVKKRPEELTPKENIVLEDIYKKLKKQTTVASVTGTTLTEVVVTGTNELLAKRWAEVLLETFEEFYKEMKTKKTREMLVMQEARLEKLQVQMFSTDRRLAQITVQNQNIVDPSGSMVQEQTRRSNSFYSQQYLAQLATVDNIRTTLINQTPIFTIVEPIRLPLVKVQSFIGSNMPVGGFIGLILSIVLVSIYTILKEVLSQLS